jgi:ABC-type transport system substrate-binding protein
MEVQVGDSPTNISKVLAGDYMVSSWGFPTQDPEPGLWSAVYSKSLNNYSKYNNPEVDKAIDQARVITDQAQRKALYDTVWEALAKDLPYYPYVKTVNGFVTSPDLKGGQVYEDGILRFDLLWKAA